VHVRTAPAETSAPPAPARPKIAVRAVTKRYDAAAGAAVLNGVDLEVGENEFVTLVGRSGCGKTTLLNIIAGLVEASAGEVLVDGVAVTGPGRGKGVVFQAQALFPWLTAIRNIEFGARSRGLDAAACLVRNDAHGFFAAEGGVVRTGPTGTNVLDLALVLAHA